MSQVSQEKGGAFKMPSQPPIGAYLDELSTAFPSTIVKTKKTPTQCGRCGGILDEVDVCGQCQTDHSLG